MQAALLQALACLPLLQCAGLQEGGNTLDELERPPELGELLLGE